MKLRYVIPQPTILLSAIIGHHTLTDKEDDLHAFAQSLAGSVLGGLISVLSLS